ncbi:hypothetical protein pb186bvf_019872 [Paramecium bursaria]
MTEKFLEIFNILMEDPQNNYIYYQEEIFKSTQMLAQLKKLLESNKDKEKERLYREFFSSTLGFLKISSNINIIPIDEVIAQYKIDKSLENFTQKNWIGKQGKTEKRSLKTEKRNVRIDYKECPSELTELDFQFHNNEPNPPFGQLFPVVQEGYIYQKSFSLTIISTFQERTIYNYLKSPVDYLQLFEKFQHQEVIKDVFVYENIILNSMSMDRQGLQVELEITPYQMAGRQPQKINWNITKR